MRAGPGLVLDRTQGPRPGTPFLITLLAAAEFNVGCLSIFQALVLYTHAKLVNRSRFLEQKRRLRRSFERNVAQKQRPSSLFERHVVQ